MRRRKLYRGLAVAFSAILLATSNPATLQNVAAKGIHLQKKAKAKMILEDPTENGAYTLSMTINKEGTSEESMLSGFIDPKIKVTVQDGKTWVISMNTECSQESAENHGADCPSFTSISVVIAVS